MRPTTTLAIALVLLPACGPDSQPPAESSGDVPLAGTYQVTSSIEVPALAAVPGAPGDALRLVDDLATNPAGAILDLAGEAGVPALDTLQAILPDPLEAEIEGWMNEHLASATVDGVSPVQELGELDAIIRSVVLRWQLRSELDLDAPDGGTHAPVAIAFDVLDEPIVIPVEVTAPVTAASGVTATIAWPDGAGGPARVAIGDHAMGVPFGHYALRAIGAVLEARYGVADVREVLGQVVDCRALAESVASRCLGPACVGHAAELSAVCGGGLDEAAARIEDRVLALDYRAIHFASGTAGATGAAVDGSGHATADGFTGGVWTATVDLGQGEAEATATFTAVR